jgi:hypothetical protein
MASRGSGHIFQSKQQVADAFGSLHGCNIYVVIPNMGHNNTMTSLSSQLPQAFVVTTTAMESALNATIIAATPADIDIRPNNLSNDTPFNYLMKCSAHVVNVTMPDVFDKGPVFDEELVIDRI